MARIVLEGISKQFGNVRALDDVSLVIEDGEFLVLLGPSGCGKSTLLRIIAGLTEPTSGRIVVGERDVTALPPRERNLAMVFQSYALYPHMTVEQNIAFGLRVRHLPKDEVRARVQDAADQLQLVELLGRRPRELSGGQRQRVALGRAIVRDPEAFLMDEPLSNLDAQLRTTTRVELANLHRRLGTTFVYVTHDQVEAMTMATRIAVMNNGRLEQLGSPADVYDEPATAFVARFIGAPAMNLLDVCAATSNRRVVFSADGVEAALFNGDIEPCRVALGVRPEHLRLMDDPRSAVRFCGRVVALENLGSEEVAILDVGSQRLCWRGARPLGVREEALVELTCDPKRIALFHADNTRRLVWLDRSPSARPDVMVGVS